MLRYDMKKKKKKLIHIIYFYCYKVYICITLSVFILFFFPSILLVTIYEEQVLHLTFTASDLSKYRFGKLHRL